VLRVLPFGEYLTFEELQESLGEMAKGETALTAPHDQNLVLWTGMSETLAGALQRLMQAGKVHFAWHGRPCRFDAAPKTRRLPVGGLETWPLPRAVWPRSRTYGGPHQLGVELRPHSAGEPAVANELIEGVCYALRKLAAGTEEADWSPADLGKAFSGIPLLAHRLAGLAPQLVPADGVEDENFLVLIETFFRQVSFHVGTEGALWLTRLPQVQGNSL
jgi:hypothetical protein